MTLRVHGIGSCDACRKARRWLAEQELEFEWVDLRETPPAFGAIERWLQVAGPERLVNRRSTTWRSLPDDARPALDAEGLAAFLREHPTLIKRPVFETAHDIRVGIDDDTRAWLATA